MVFVLFEFFVGCFGSDYIKVAATASTASTRAAVPATGPPAIYSTGPRGV